MFYPLSFGEGWGEVFETIALQCPVFYGPAVYQARVVLFDINKQQYMSECEKVAPDAQNAGKRLAKTAVETSKVNLYPNPATNEVYIEADGYDNIGIKLYNIIGELVIEKTVSNNNSLDINKLLSGIYTYKIFSANKELKVGKLIITH